LNTEDFLKLSPEYQKIYLEQVDSNLELAKTVRMKAASEAVAQEEDYRNRRAKNRDKVASSYNLMRLMQGQQPITSRDDDVIVPTPRNPIKMHAGSSTAADESTTDSDKVRKSFELMQMFGGR
jgi:hypothetical protein